MNFLGKQQCSNIPLHRHIFYEFSFSRLWTLRKEMQEYMKTTRDMKMIIDMHLRDVQAASERMRKEVDTM
jgi:hypothetical protein